MAAKYSKVVDEPIKDILGNIHESHIKFLTRDLYNGDKSKIPVIEYFGGTIVEANGDLEKQDGLTVSQLEGKTILKLSATPNATLPEIHNWMQLLAGKTRLVGVVHSSLQMSTYEASSMSITQ